MGNNHVTCEGFEYLKHLSVINRQNNTGYCSSLMMDEEADSNNTVNDLSYCLWANGATAEWIWSYVTLHNLSYRSQIDIGVASIV